MRVTHNTVDIQFEALGSDAAGASASGGGARKRYSLGLDLLPPHPQEEKWSRSLDPQQSSFDVADQNMAVVLCKSDACGEYWRADQSAELSGDGSKAMSSEDIAYSQAAFFRQRPFRTVEEESARSDLTAAPASEQKKKQQVGLTLDLQNALQSMHFSSGEALFDLD